MNQIRSLSLITVMLYDMATLAQMPERILQNVDKYKKICREHIYKGMKGMLFNY